MNTNILLLLQALLIFGQSVNVGIAFALDHPNKVLVLIISSGVGSLQFLVQHIGNQTGPGK